MSGSPVNTLEEYIAHTVESFPAGGGYELLYSRVDGATRAMPEHLVRTLERLDSFRTLGEHRERLAAEGWGEQDPGALQSILDELLRAGLLRSKSSLLQGLQKDIAPTPPQISVLAWITAGRRQSLEKSMRSHIDNARRHARTLEYMVCDDSVPVLSDRGTRETLSRLASEEQVRILYMGTVEKARLRGALLEACKVDLLPDEVVDFALFDPEGAGHPVGANRNALLLATAGALALSIDDDTACVPARPFPVDKRLGFCSWKDPTKVRFFPSRAAARAAVETVDLDVLFSHEALLGKAASRIVSELASTGSSPVDTRDLKPGLADVLASGRARVAVTAAGMYGDSGTGSPRMVLSMPEPARAAIMASEREYRSALTCREVVRGVDRNTVSDARFLMAMQMGLDNRGVLPPFFPVRRNQDGVFAATLRACDPAGLIGHIPLATFHDPQETRQFPEGAFNAVRPLMSDLILLLVDSFTPVHPCQDPSENFRSLGHSLKEVGSYDLSSFEERLCSGWISRQSAYLCRLDALLEEFGGEPEFWRDDIILHRESIKEQLSGAHPALPQDLAGGRSAEEGMMLARRLVGMFGELMIWWPVMVKASRELRRSRAHIASTL